MKVTIRNLRGISSLEFEVPGNGVWIMTGLNGSGKTSLFASLFRMKAQHAFQKFYRSGGLDDRIDAYQDAEIEYVINSKVVKYHYGGQRWRATPRSNASLFDDVSYSSIEYIEASGKRIEPFSEEIRSNRVRHAHSDISSFMSKILNNNKWDNLRKVTTRRGGDKTAYLLPYNVGSHTFYYSERSFSLGELCVLRLAEKLKEVRNGALLIIDEIEMALHPQAQYKLLKELEKIAEQKSLTILFSTHSATIIKHADREHLMLLCPNGSGKVNCIKGAFPAQVLGEIAYSEELNADIIFFVEDLDSQKLADIIISKYLNHQFTPPKAPPLYKVVPVGTWSEVIRLVHNSSALWGSHVKRFAFLDKDAGVEHIPNMLNSSGDEALKAAYRGCQRNIIFLPCVPEEGLIDFINNTLINDPSIENKVRDAIGGSRPDIRRIVSSPDFTSITGDKPRKVAKNRLKHLIEKIKADSLLDESSIKRTFYAAYAEAQYPSTGSISALLGPVISTL